MTFQNARACPPRTIHPVLFDRGHVQNDGCVESGNAIEVLLFYNFSCPYQIRFNDLSRMQEGKAKAPVSAGTAFPMKQPCVHRVTKHRPPLVPFQGRRLSQIA